MTALACVALFVPLLALASAQGPIVDTTYGPVQGVDVTLASGTVIQTFMGIPFARAPVGDLRFEPPQPPEPWTEVLDTSNLGFVCMQGEWGGGIWDMYVNDEDCLHMNIYSKQRSGEELHPVMVWIHGGGFNGGTNFEYPGYFMAEKDVVYVALNYRLGMLGFAYLNDGTIEGNMGLWDNILALQFIQDNIAAFGGDPNQVTIFGQSSGGSNVGILESAPQAEGLFHGAILQSGVGIAPWSVMLEKFNATDYVYQVANSVGCPTISTDVMVACLRTTDAQQLADSDSISCTTGSTACQGFQPVVEGNLIPDVPILMRERGDFHKVPEMLGLTEEDGYGWGPSYIWDGISREETLNLWRSQAAWGAALWPDPTAVEDYVQGCNWYYADWPYLDDPDRNRAMMGNFLTDYWYGASADYQAKTTVRDGNPAYFYIHKYMRENNVPNDWNGTPHSAELPFLFGYAQLLDNPEALAHSQFPPSFLAGYQFTQRDKDYGDFMATLWTNFAKHWDPTPEPVELPGAAASQCGFSFRDPTPEPVELPGVATIDWDSYVVGNLSYAYLDVVPYTSVDYRQQNYAFQNRYMNYILYDKEF